MLLCVTTIKLSRGCHWVQSFSKYSLEDELHFLAILSFTLVKFESYIFELSGVIGDWSIFSPIFSSEIQFEKTQFSSCHFLWYIYIYILKKRTFSAIVTLHCGRAKEGFFPPSSSLNKFLKNSVWNQMISAIIIITWWNLGVFSFIPKWNLKFIKMSSYHSQIFSNWIALENKCIPCCFGKDQRRLII